MNINDVEIGMFVRLPHTNTQGVVDDVDIESGMILVIEDGAQEAAQEDEFVPGSWVFVWDIEKA